MKIKTIKCKQCYVPLSLLGSNYRNKNLICHHCGTVMDTKNEFKALYTFTHIQAQESKLQIGKLYIFQDIKFTLTGYITYSSHEVQWIEYQLYSLTHGYAKLVYLNNKYIFLRKTHYLPDPNIWLLNQGDQFLSRHIHFKIKSFYFAEIYYASGNLTEKIAQGQRSKQCFASHNKQWFHSIYRRYAVENFVGYEIQQPL